MNKRYNPLLELKKPVSQMLKAFEPIAKVNKLDLNNPVELKVAAEIYILTQKPKGGAPLKRGLKNISPFDLALFMAIIREMKTTKEGEETDILKRSIDQN